MHERHPYTQQSITVGRVRKFSRSDIRRHSPKVLLARDKGQFSLKISKFHNFLPTQHKSILKTVSLFLSRSVLTHLFYCFCDAWLFCCRGLKFADPCHMLAILMVCTSIFASKYDHLHLEQGGKQAHETSRRSREICWSSFPYVS